MKNITKLSLVFLLVAAVFAAPMALAVTHDVLLNDVYQFEGEYFTIDDINWKYENSHPYVYLDSEWYRLVSGTYAVIDIPDPDSVRLLTSINCIIDNGEKLCNDSTTGPN